MAISGTVGQTTIDVTTVIEHAFRRCGKLASTVSGELQMSARENLFLLLTDLANRGLSLWCVQKTVLGVIPNQSTFALPVGTVDVLNALYRTKTDLTGTTISAAGWQGLDLGAGSETAVVNAAIRCTGAASNTLVLEGSDDNFATYTQYATFPTTLTLPTAAWLTVDADNSGEHRYWRVRDTDGVLPTVATLTFSTEPVEVPMSKLSRDDYVSFPNKVFSVPAGSMSLQFWFDKQIAPRVSVWPQSQGSVDQIVVWTQRHIQDVGAYSNTLDVPQRWLESVILKLALRCALELPAGELPPGRYELLKGEAAESLVQAEDGESDGSPIRLSPNIRGYTS